MKTETTSNTTNGIDTPTQKKIIETLGKQPPMAQVLFSVDNTWKGGTRSTSSFTTFTAAGQEHHHETPLRVETDMPGVFLGSDQAPTPTEHALQALASCMNTTMVYNCAAQGIEVRSSRVHIEGEMDARGFLRIEDHIRPGFETVRAQFEVDADAPDDVIQQLIQGSPMFDVFSNPVPVTVQLRMK